MTKTKHIEIEHHFKKEKIKEGIVCLSHISTKFQEPNTLTKSIPKSGFELL